MDARPVPGRKPLPTKGSLAHLEAPGELIGGEGYVLELAGEPLES